MGEISMTLAPLDFAALRKRLGFTQAEMAQRMAISKRNVEMLEAAPEKAEARYTALAYMVALEIALERGDASLAPESLVEKALQLAKLAKRSKALLPVFGTQPKKN